MTPEEIVDHFYTNPSADFLRIAAGLDDEQQEGDE